MSQKDIKKKANIWIRRRGEKGFQRKKEAPGGNEKNWPILIFPIPEEPKIIKPSQFRP